MYSASDFEKLWFLDKTGGEPKGISLNSFCSSHGVHYAQFNTWFRKTQYTERVDKFVRIDFYWRQTLFRRIDLPSRMWHDRFPS